MIAKYDRGKCGACKCTIKKGDDLRKIDSKWIHTSCIQARRSRAAAKLPAPKVPMPKERSDAGTKQVTTQLQYTSFVDFSDDYEIPDPEIRYSLDRSRVEARISDIMRRAAKELSRNR